MAWPRQRRNRRPSCPGGEAWVAKRLAGGQSVGCRLLASCERFVAFVKEFDCRSAAYLLLYPRCEPCLCMPRRTVDSREPGRIPVSSGPGTTLRSSQRCLAIHPAVYRSPSSERSDESRTQPTTRQSTRSPALTHSPARKNQALPQELECLIRVRRREAAQDANQAERPGSSGITNRRSASAESTPKRRQPMTLTLKVPRGEAGVVNRAI